MARRERLCGVYLITCVPTGRRYVGQSTDIHRRWIGHRHSLNRAKGKNLLMERSWKKHGESSFKFEILELCSEERLTERETYWLNFYQCRVAQGGFNHIEPADNPLGPPILEETRRKMSESKAFKYEAFGQKLTLRQWGEKLGVSHEAIRARLKSGTNIEEALTKPVGIIKVYRLGRFEGNIAQLAKHMNVPLSRVKNRLAEKQCLTKALLTPDRSSSRRSTQHRIGVVTGSITEIIRSLELNQTLGTVQSRLRNGWCPTKALLLPNRRLAT